MKLREASPCLNCEHLAQRVATLEDKLLQAMERIAKLEEENARLQQQLAAAREESSTSSKPSSSDIVKPKKPLIKGGKKRNKGGQPRHRFTKPAEDAGLLDFACATRSAVGYTKPIAGCGVYCLGPEIVARTRNVPRASEASGKSPREVSFSYGCTDYYGCTDMRR
jgi:hypothetical protein